MEVKAPFKANSKVLEVGGGEIPLFRPNFDMRKLPSVDIVGNIEETWPIENESFDGIFGKFVIEHVAWRRLPFFIAECYRVLKPGGSVMMVGPNTLEQCKEIVRRNKISIDESSMIFGGQEEPGWNEHKAAFSPDYAKELFLGAGFVKVEVEPWPIAQTDMIIRAWKGDTSVDNTEWLKKTDVDMQNHLSSRQNAPKKVEMSKNKVKLNIGSFTVMYKDWINVDILDLSEYAKQNGFIFKQRDITKGIPCDENSVDAIVSSHLLEHISRKASKAFLMECYRVMKPGATIRIAVPDVLKLAHYYGCEANFMKRFNYNDGVKNAEDGAEAFWNLTFAGHVTAYDANAVAQKLQDCGFVDVKVMKQGESRDPSIQNETKDMYPDHSSYIEGVKPSTLITTSPSKKVTEAIWNTFESRETENVPHVGGKLTRVQELVDAVVTPTDKRLNIGLISTAFFGCPPKGYSGLEMIVWDLAEGLCELGHRVRLYAPEGSQAPLNGELIVTGPALSAVNVNWLEAEEKINNVVSTYFRDLDILHGHNWFGFEYALHGRGSKICHTHHGHLNPDWWLKEKPPYKLNFIAISNWMRSLYESKGLSSKFVYNGINVDKYGFKENKGDRLLYVGRISKFKQPHVAIELAKRLNIGLDIVGGTFVDDKEYLERIKSQCDGTQIAFNPDVSHEEKVKFMQDAKCLLFPSAMGEPFGLVAAEAMACGTPVIALNDGAISEVVNNTVTGYTLNSYSEIKDNKHLDELCSKISPNACRVRVLTMFSRKIMAENYVRLYKEILANKEW